jgi:hypothetical protein
MSCKNKKMAKNKQKTNKTKTKKRVTDRTVPSRDPVTPIPPPPPAIAVIGLLCAAQHLTKRTPASAATRPSGAAASPTPAGEPPTPAVASRVTGSDTTSSTRESASETPAPGAALAVSPPGRLIVHRESSPPPCEASTEVALSRVMSITAPSAASGDCKAKKKSTQPQWGNLNQSFNQLINTLAKKRGDGGGVGLRKCSISRKNKQTNKQKKSPFRNNYRPPTYTGDCGRDRIGGHVDKEIDRLDGRAHDEPEIRQREE